MSDDFTFDPDDALDVRDILDKPDINDYLYDYEPEWEQIWETAPVEDMTEGQLESFIDMVIDHWSEMDWEDIYGGWDDFWDWFRENY